MIMQFDGVSNQELSKFIRNYGVDMYGSCFCESGAKYRFCCYKNKHINMEGNELKQFTSKLFAQIWTFEDIKTNKCMFTGCVKNSIGSHSFQRRGVLLFIEPVVTRKLGRFIPNFKNGVRKTNVVWESHNKATIFWGFCKDHDRDVFANIEQGNAITLNDEQKYAFIYRSISFMSNKCYRLKMLNIEKHYKLHHDYYTNKTNKDNILGLKTYYIFDIISKKLRYDNIEAYRQTIELNFDDKIGKWNLINKELTFSDVRYIDTSKVYFVFHNTRIINEDAQAYYDELGFNKVNKEDNNFLTTILVPISSTRYALFFAIRKSADIYLQNFIREVNSMECEKLRNCLNNLIIDSNEEFYFSQEYYDDIISDSDKEALIEYIDKRNEKIDSEVLDYRSLFNKPLVDLIKII